MSESKNKVSEAQKEAQKKYDQKTKMVSVKYTPSDMSDYDRMMNYLNRTGQTTNGFIKKLIKEFFDWSTDERNRKEFYISCIGEENLDRLKGILNNDEEKCNIILSLYADETEKEIETALSDKSCDFEEWVDNLEENIADGNVNMESEQFSREIENNMCEYINSIYY